MLKFDKAHCIEGAQESWEKIVSDPKKMDCEFLEAMGEDLYDKLMEIKNMIIPYSNIAFNVPPYMWEGSPKAIYALNKIEQIIQEISKAYKEKDISYFEEGY